MKKSTHRRLTAWLLPLALVVTLLPGIGMTALAVEAGGEGTGPPAVEVVEPEGGNSGSDETVGTPLLPRAGDKTRRTTNPFDEGGNDLCNEQKVKS